MRVRELIDRYERRRLEAVRLKASGLLAEAYSLFLEELRGLDGNASDGGYVNTRQASEILNLDSRTVARKAQRGEINGAMKTSGKSGEWRIPLGSLQAGSTPQPRSETRVPRLLGG